MFGGKITDDGVAFLGDVLEVHMRRHQRLAVSACWVEAFLAVVGNFLILGFRHFGVASEDVLSKVSLVLFFGDVPLEPAELVQGVPADDGPLLEGGRPVFKRPEVVAHLE